LIQDALSLESELADILNLQAPGQMYHPQMAVEETAEPVESDIEEEAPYSSDQNGLFMSDKAPVTPRHFMRWLFLPLAVLMLSAFGGARLAHSISQGYSTSDTTLKKGMVVSLSSDSTQDHPAVQSADVTNVDKIVGVVVGMNDTLITVGSATAQIYVATTGQLPAYVSDLNGLVKKGDLISLSPLKGVLMKADDNGSIGVMGTALEDYPLSSAQTVTVNDSSGKPATVHVGLVNVDINMKPTTVSTSSQNWLQRLGKSITGHNVSELRVVAALAIFVTLLVIEGTVIYSAVSGSLISMGRNPLAKNQILWQLVRSMGMAFVVLLAAGSVIAIILWM
jgi:hypothetical protein